MPSTYSTRLRLELQAVGENSSTWGVILNTQLGTLLEQAVAGVGAIAMPDANYTLTVANGASDEARNAVLALTGALTSARNLIVPAVTKTYLVRNGTSGGYAVTVKTSGGSGVAVPAGHAALVYCDGTDVLQGSVAYNPATNAIAADVTGAVTGAASANVLKAGDTMTGDLAVSKATPAISLTKPAAGTAASLVSRVGAALRWSMLLGDGTAEGGANAGSDFALARYNDAGVFVAYAITVNRASGAVAVAGGLSTGGNAVWHAGNFDPGDYATLVGATFAGPVGFGDGSHYLTISGGVALRVFDTNDYDAFTRASNTYALVIGAATQFQVSATAAVVTPALTVQAAAGVAANNTIFSAASFTVAATVVTMGRAHNAGTVTRSGLGRYAFTFTSAAPAADYIVVITTSATGDNNAFVGWYANRTVNGFDLNFTDNSSDQPFDPTGASVMVMLGS